MTSLDLIKIRETANKTAETLKGYLHDNEGWQISKKTKDVLIEYKHSKAPGFEKGFLYRGQTEYNCPKETVFRYLDPSEGVNSLRIKWDKDIKNIETLKCVDGDTKINRSMTNSAAMGLISPRDFVDIILTLKTDDCISTSGVSIDLPEFPPDSKYVRGWNYPCGLMCLAVPGKPNCTKLMTFIQPDIKGMLPKSLVDSAMSGSMVGFFNNLRDILQKDGHLEK